MALVSLLIAQLAGGADADVRVSRRPCEIAGGLRSCSKHSVALPESARVSSHAWARCGRAVGLAMGSVVIPLGAEVEHGARLASSILGSAIEGCSLLARRAFTAGRPRVRDRLRLSRLSNPECWVQAVQEGCMKDRAVARGCRGVMTHYCADLRRE